MPNLILTQFKELASKGGLLSWNSYMADFQDAAKKGDLGKKVKEFFEELIRSPNHSHEFWQKMQGVIQLAARQDADFARKLTEINRIGIEQEKNRKIAELFMNNGFINFWAHQLTNAFQQKDELSKEDQLETFERNRAEALSEKFTRAADQVMYKELGRVVALFMNLCSDLIDIARINAGYGLPLDVNQPGDDEEKKKIKYIPMK